MADMVAGRAGSSGAADSAKCGFGPEVTPATGQTLAAAALSHLSLVSANAGVARGKRTAWEARAPSRDNSLRFCRKKGGSSATSTRTRNDELGCLQIHLEPWRVPLLDALKCLPPETRYVPPMRSILLFDSLRPRLPDEFSATCLPVLRSTVDALPDCLARFLALSLGSVRLWWPFVCHGMRRHCGRWPGSGWFRHECQAGVKDFVDTCLSWCRCV
jgi:hypothetical protein